MKIYKISLLITLITCLTQPFFSQNFLDKYLSDPLVYTNIATSVNGINQPRDLDFKPNSMELWVVNYGNSQGGSNVVIHNAGLPNQYSNYQKDSHSGHFMLYPSAIAFSDIGEWANTNEVKNSNNNNTSTFMGPALWSADTNLHARIFQNNWQAGFPLGSHIDMLHQSPFSMGIAHENAKIYWVADGHNGNLCKYDFVTDHGPGYDDHSAGKLWRHTDISILRAVGVPGHMVMDKSTKWLYIVDAGNKTVFRVNTNTGTIGANLSPLNEPLASYKAVTGATKETIDTYTSQPCGIDYYNDRLIVGDYTTGEIRVYNTAASTPSLMGTIVTGQPGIMGLKIGHDGKIWFVNKTLNKVVRIDPLPASNDASVIEILSPSVVNFIDKYHSPTHNVCSGSIEPVVTIQNMGSNLLTSCNINYKLDNGTVVTYSWTGSLAVNAVTTVTLTSATVSDDEHQLHVYTSNPNGTADNNPMNDRKQGAFRSKVIIKSLPFLEDFSLSTFPPIGWSYMGFNKFCKMSHVNYIGAYGLNDGALKMDNSSGGDDITGQTDYFMSPRFDLSTTEIGTKLEFDLAYAQYSSSTDDRLDIKASTDCGLSWTSIYDKAGFLLSTADPQSNPFYPTDEQWRTEAVDLDSLVGKEVMFLFTSTSNFGNNFFIDNIKINMVSTVGIVEKKKTSVLKIYPNPSNGKIIIESSSANISNTEIHTLLGMNISKDLKMNSQDGKLIIDLSTQASGTYFVRMQTENGTVVKKVILQK